MLSQPEDWIVPDWPAPARVRAMITSRNGGCSIGSYASMNLGLQAGDNEANVNANRSILRQFLPAEPKWLNQVHGNRVVRADMIAVAAEADASFTSSADCVCVVLIADCLPILICERTGNLVAVAHAGWRGLVSGVIEKTVCALETDPKELIAYLGPGIGPSAFEVGDDVRDAFLAVDAAAQYAFQPKDTAGKWCADLFALARQRLVRLGVADVYGGGLCTYSDPMRFFSHRRARPAGRMAALIWIEDRPAV
jgi:YfiH family protein